MKLGQRVTEIKLLTKLVILGYVLRPLNLHVMPQAIHLIVQVHTQVLARVHPGEHVSTQLKTCKFFCLFRKRNTFCFAFLRIRISAEPEIMISCIFLTNEKHFLKCMKTRCHQKVIIRITKNSAEFSIHPAAKLIFP